MNNNNLKIYDLFNSKISDKKIILKPMVVPYFILSKNPTASSPSPQEKEKFTN